MPFVRSLYIAACQAIGAMGIIYALAPPSLEDLTHIAVSGLVDCLNEVGREGTDLVSVTRELGLDWGHILYVSSGRLQMYLHHYTLSTLW